MMRRILKLFLICACPLFLFACASVNTKLPMPTKAQIDLEADIQETNAFARYLNMRKRLDKVGAPILAANAELCKNTRNDFGVITHTEKSYSKHLRGAAKRQLNVRKKPSVLFVREGSSEGSLGHRNGFKAGDVIIGQDGKPVSAQDKSLADTSTLQIRRAGEEIFIKVQPTPICDYGISLKISGAVNAYANGKSITVTSAMMDFVNSDAELALVVGHELAHNTMKHVRKAIWNTIISGFASRTTRPFESEADYVGLYYMARAGYNLNGVEDFWRRLGVEHPKSIVRAKTHPVTPERLLAIRLAAKEIETKRASGMALLPNSISANSKQ